jgi:Zn-dependent membrane protease YugP
MALILIATGYFLKVEILVSIGILLFAHASFDRILGYGLKYETGFRDTHLGCLEKSSTKPTFQ